MTGWPPPLRWFLPALLLAIGLGTGVVAALLEVRTARERAVLDLTSRAQVLGTLIGGAVEAAFRASRHEDASRAVQGLVSDRQLDLAALLDADGRVLSATRFALGGQPADSLGVIAEALTATDGSWDNGAAILGERWLVGRFPVLLAPGPGELLPTRRGLLVLVYDLRESLAGASAAGLRHAGVIAAIVLLLAGMVGLLFRVWVTRRVDHVVAATRAMADGQYAAPPALGGRDELAQVGAALQELAAELSTKADLEAQLRQSQKMEAFGQFAGGVAHDFNNILAAISGHVSLLLDETPPGDTRRADLLEIQRSTERAADLTRQLLTFGRRQVTHVQVIGMGQVIRGVETLLRRLLGTGIRLEVDLPAGLGAVRADRGQLEQVLVNLALNARDAMPGGGTFRLTAREVDRLHDWPEELPAGRWVIVECRDTGTGVPPEIRGRIFEPFFTTKPMGKGTGLGLATVHAILRQAGGAIRVRPAEGGGSCFEFALPWSAPADDAEVVAPAAPPAAGRGEMVLIVDDEPAVLDVFGRILARAGYQALCAGDQATALRHAAAHAGAIRLLISDVLMPDGDGVALVGRLRGFTGPVPALFISGFADTRTEELTLLRQGDAFLLKPVAADALLAKVAELLAADGGPLPGVGPA